MPFEAPAAHMLPEGLRGMFDRPYKDFIQEKNHDILKMETMQLLFLVEPDLQQTFIKAICDNYHRMDEKGKLLVRHALWVCNKNSKTSSFLTELGAGDGTILLSRELADLVFDQLGAGSNGKTMWITFVYTPALGLTGVDAALSVASTENTVAHSMKFDGLEIFPLAWFEDHRFRKGPAYQYRESLLTKTLPKWEVYLNPEYQHISFCRQLAQLSVDFIVNIRSLLVDRECGWHDIDLSLDELQGFGYIFDALSNNVKYGPPRAKPHTETENWQHQRIFPGQMRDLNFLLINGVDCDNNDTVRYAIFVVDGKGNRGKEVRYAARPSRGSVDKPPVMFSYRLLDQDSSRLPPWIEKGDKKACKKTQGEHNKSRNQMKEHADTMSLWHKSWVRRSAFAPRTADKSWKCPT